MTSKIVGKNSVDLVASAFLAGKIVALPTETVFGIGVIYDNVESFNNLIFAKNRPLEKAFPLVIGNISQIRDFAYLNDRQMKIISKYFPGPLTVVLKRKEHVPFHVTNGKETIAIRMPDDKFILKVLDKANKPILLTSANKSGEKPVSNHLEAFEIFKDYVDVIVEGASLYNQASTIIGFEEDDIILIRQGVISFEELSKLYMEE